MNGFYMYTKLVYGRLLIKKNCVIVNQLVAAGHKVRELFLPEPNEI